jgi:hypothetical protein
MLGHGGLTDREHPDELVDATLRAAELVQNAYPGRLREDRERVD